MDVLNDNDVGTRWHSIGRTVTQLESDEAPKMAIIGMRWLLELSVQGLPQRWVFRGACKWVFGGGKACNAPEDPEEQQLAATMSWVLAELIRQRTHTHAHAHARALARTHTRTHTLTPLP